jgi:DNA ligase-1
MLGPLLAETYGPGIDPTGYYMSEKLDGLRCLWNPRNRTFYSRTGKVYAAPKFFSEKLPNVLLDGELWLGRGMLERTNSIVRSAQDKGWTDVRFCLIDIPDRDAGPFEARQEVLRSLARVGMGERVQVIPHTRCTGPEMLEQALSLVIAQGGEGIMLRKPGSLYEHRRSFTLLKVKRFMDDEAVVVGYQPAKNGMTGLMGALLCVRPSGMHIKVGTGFDLKIRRNPPPIGCTITFRFCEVTSSGKPRTPSFVRIRPPE